MNMMRAYNPILKQIAANFINVKEHRPSISKSITILEIGVERGMSTRNFISGLRRRQKKGGYGELYSIEWKKKWKGYVEKRLEDLELWHFIHGDSRKVEWDGDVDILLIDGKHDYDVVKSDFERFEPYVKEGGLILMHDVLHPKLEVKDYWSEIEYPKSVLPLNRSGMGIVNKNG